MPETRRGWPQRPLNGRQMLQTFGEFHTSSIHTISGVISPFLGNFWPSLGTNDLVAVLQTDLIRVQGCPQGRGRNGRSFKPSGNTTGRRSRTNGGVIGPHFVNFLPILGTNNGVRWLPQTVLVRVQGCPQGLGTCGRSFEASTN